MLAWKRARRRPERKLFRITVRIHAPRFVPGTNERRAAQHRSMVSCNRSSASAPAPPVRRRSEEHTSELQSLMRISYAVFCLKKKNNINTPQLRYAVTSHYLVVTLTTG